MHVNAEQLQENIDAVALQSPTLAIKAVQLAILLDGPARLPRAMLGQLLSKEGDNPCLMSVLQMLVLRRLYMYETEHDDKHWALEVFQLRSQQSAISWATKKEGRGLQPIQ